MAFQFASVPHFRTIIPKQGSLGSNSFLITLVEKKTEGEAIEKWGEREVDKETEDICTSLKEKKLLVYSRGAWSKSKNKDTVLPSLPLRLLHVMSNKVTLILVLIFLIGLIYMSHPSRKFMKFNCIIDFIRIINVD